MLARGGDEGGRGRGRRGGGGEEGKRGRGAKEREEGGEKNCFASRAPLLPLLPSPSSLTIHPSSLLIFNFLYFLNNIYKYNSHIAHRGNRTSFDDEYYIVILVYKENISKIYKVYTIKKYI